MTQAIGRGVFNRRAALAWIREHGDVDAVVYFADDDNAYDTRIFEEVRATIRISVFPVGLVQEFGISSPIVRVRRSFLFITHVLSVRFILKLIKKDIQ
jgi:beta-1,3-glucuronyltransferase